MICGILTGSLSPLRLMQYLRVPATWGVAQAGPTGLRRLPIGLSFPQLAALDPCTDSDALGPQSFRTSPPPLSHAHSLQQNSNLVLFAANGACLSSAEQGVPAGLLVRGEVVSEVPTPSATNKCVFF